MRAKKSGFTLSELLVVIVIFSVILTIAVLKFRATASDRKALSAISVLGEIYTGVSLYQMRGGTAFNAQLTTQSSPLPACSEAATVTQLIACGYVPDRDWSNMEYEYFVCNGKTVGTGCCAANNYYVCAQRKPSYDWIYYVGSNCANGGTAPPCPQINR